MFGGFGKKKREAGLVNTHRTRMSFVLAASVLLIAAASVLFVRFLSVQLYEQRAYSLGQTTEKIVEVMNEVIDNEWERLHYVSYELARSPQATREDLLERLSSFYGINSERHSWKISCIDSGGNLYGWDGAVGRWSYPNMLIKTDSDYQVTIFEARESDNEQMGFMYRLPEPIQLTEDDVTITHTLLTLDMAAFGESLEVSSFEGTSFSYITEKNGTRIYHQQNQNEFIAAYNLLTALQNSEFLYEGSYEELVAAISSDTSYTAEVAREGKNYFVSYASLSVNDWSLYLFVPEEHVGGNTADFVTQLVWQMSVITLLVVILISAFVWTNSRQTLARQRLAVDEANRASQAKSDFLSHMSHDMRTPLNGIMGMCHIAKQRLGDREAVADSLDKIDISSRLLLALINDVLDMARIEKDKVEVNLAPVDLRELIRICSIHIEVSVYENNITFERDTAGIRHPYVSADAVLIEKILTNILGNAAKFTPAGGRITLRASETEIAPGQGSYRFEIEDTGRGMTPEFLKHLFEPFSQEKVGSRTRYQGTGLGLSIVKSLVDTLGGQIEVRSTENVGSTFTITLPFAQLSAEDFPKNEESIEPFDGTGLHALLVDDNDLNRMIAKAILEECGLTVEDASNGGEAVGKFKASEPGSIDIIIMDVRMPVMDGLEASRCIRALERPDAAAVPIIALTADALSGDMEKTRAAGMNDHLGKPIEIDKLYAVLRKHFPNGKAEPKP